jgi:hypothetical protein
MIGRGDDPPGVVVLAHVPAPGERLVGDAQAPRGGALGQCVQLLGREIVIGDGLGIHGRAREHRVDAEVLHHVELRLGATQVALQHRVGHGLEVAERLVERDPQAQRGRLLAHLGRSRRRAHEVRLEELHGVEARVGGRHELLLERAAQADGR